MGLTSAVLAICEANLDDLAKRDHRDYVDFESDEYYSWLVDESNKMADYIFEGIEEYFTSGDIQPPPDSDN